MLLLDRDFLKPTKKLRALAIMESLALDNMLSQHRLSELSGMSNAMVNQYLKTLKDEALIAFEPINGKSFSYCLTGEGETVRRTYFETYCSEIVRSYSALKSMILNKLQMLEEKGRTGLVLFGASETCEVVLSAIKDTPFRIVAIVDNDPQKHGRTIHGHVIQPPVVLDNLACHAVVITSFGRQDEIHKQLVTIYPGKEMEIVRL
ncbi:MAG: transcriptional regulator [Desulfovibrionaceae bacterium]